MPILALLAACLVAFVLRVAPSFAWPPSGTDSGYHLLLRRTIRDAGMRPPRRVACLVLDERLTYPWLYHWGLALLPARWLVRCPGLPSALVDTAHTALVFLATLWIGARAPAGVDPLHVAFVAAMLFATAPALLAVGIGPRAYDVTPRPAGELLFSGVMVAGMVGTVGGAPGAWVAAAACGGALLLASKFAAQVMLFCLPVVALATRTPMWLVVLPASVVVALVVSGGGYRWILLGQIRHLALYRARVQKQFSIVVARNEGGAVPRAILSALRRRDRESARDLVLTLERNTWALFVGRNVLALAVLAAVLLGSAPAPRGGQEATPCVLLAWAFAPLVPFAATSLRSFLFLGEAERYPEYGVAAVAMLAARAAAGLSPSAQVVAGAAYAALSAPVLGHALFRLRLAGRRRRARVEPLAMCAALDRLPADACVLPVPSGAAFAFAWRTRPRWMTTQDGIVWARDHDAIWSRYPWPLPDLAAWRRRGARYVLSEELRPPDPGRPAYLFEGLERIFDDGTFTLYRLPDDGDAAPPGRLP